MARDPNDIFNDPFDNWDDSIDASPRRSGRPSTRRTPSRGNNGRPRVRPLQDKYSRRRGRPSLNSSSIADKIERESLVSGGLIDKSIVSSVKGMEKTISTFQSKVITPLAKSVSTFANSVNKFNAYHQQYLKDQMAFSKEIHETFKLFRKASIDPLLRNMARMQKGTSAMYSTFGAVADSGYTKKEFRQFVNQMGEIDDKLEKSLRAGVVATEATDTFLKEYYKTTKSTSKFLNSVAYAAEDISEDIAELRDNMAKYFKGKNSSKSVLQDQTEALRKIEKNTAAPTIGKRIMSGIFSSLVAAGKTAFKYNRYGTSQLIAQLTGFKVPNYESMGSNTLMGKVGKVVQDAYDVAIRQKVRDAEGNLQYTYQAANTGMYGSVAQGAAEGLGRAGRSFNATVQAIRKAWDESTTKQWAKYFWAVGETFILNAWDRAGAMGERSINATITNYGSKKGRPHPGEHLTAEEAISKVVDGIQSGKYKRNENVIDLFRNRGSNALDFDGDLSYGSNALAKAPTKGGYTFKKREVKGNIWDRGSKVATFESKSESDINSADISNPKAAFASLAKLQGRTVGYLKKIWSRTKEGTEEVREKGKGLWDKIKEGFLGAGAAFGATKAGRFLRGGAKGFKGLGVAGLGALGLGAAGLRGAKLGGTARTLWDIFGWGSTKGAGHMPALGLFKTTKLGQGGIGRFVRRANIAAAGKGTDLGSRIFGGLLHANKWGGIMDPLGALAGLWHGAGVKLTKVPGKLLPSMSLGGRQAIAKIGGVAAVGGSRLAGLAKATKGSLLSKIPSKDKLLGGILGGVGAKILGKTAGKGAAKTLTKQIPILGGLIGIGLGIGRFCKGDVLGGILEMTSGLLTIVPTGIGNSAALGIDAFLIGRDIKNSKKKKNKVKKKLKSKNVTKAMGLGPNPSSASIAAAGAAAVNKAKGSKENLVSAHQQQVAAMRMGGNPYLMNVNSPMKKQVSKPGFFGSIGKSISNAVSSAGSAIQYGADQFQYQASGKTTNAINWNGKRHDLLMPEFETRLFAAAEDMYKHTGHKVSISSAIRTDEEQANLYYRWSRGEKGIYMPAKPVYDYPQYGIKGTHNQMRTGHLAGGAVDVNNWGEFQPYATKHGLVWFGKKDPVHFQINKSGPVITSKSKPAPKKPAASPATGKPVQKNQSTMANKPGGANKYQSTMADKPSGFGDGAISSHPATPIASNSAPATVSNIQTEVSPMVQDWGLAIINNLIFA